MFKLLKNIIKDFDKPVWEMTTFISTVILQKRDAFH